LEAAKRGEPVCNRDGFVAEKVRILEGFHEKCCVAAQWDDASASLFGADGRKWNGYEVGDPWLFMAPRKREGWIAFGIRDNDSVKYGFAVASHVHKTADEARQWLIKVYPTVKNIQLVQVEVEL